MTKSVFDFMKRDREGVSKLYRAGPSLFSWPTPTTGKTPSQPHPLTDSRSHKRLECLDKGMGERYVTLKSTHSFLIGPCYISWVDIPCVKTPQTRLYALISFWNLVLQDRFSTIRILDLSLQIDANVEITNCCAIRNAIKVYLVVTSDYRSKMYYDRWTWLI